MTKKRSGFRIITINRPLRLSFQMTQMRCINYENKIRDRLISRPNKKPLTNRQKTSISKLFSRLDYIYPHFEDRLYLDWNQVYLQISKILLREEESRYPIKELEIFRNAFTEVNENAKPVLSRKKGSRYEPDPSLRQTDKVSMDENVRAYFEREVKSICPDAWLDDSIRDPYDDEIGIIEFD